MIRKHGLGGKKKRKTGDQFSLAKQARFALLGSHNCIKYITTAQLDAYLIQKQLL